MKRESRMQFIVIDVPVPAHDCDVVLRFANGRRVTVQCRPSNADVRYNGSLDIILPRNQPVTCWEGDHMKPAKPFRRRERREPETRVAKQLATELP
jgi:hypothetical protein